MRLRLSGSLFTCGRCGKGYSSPLGHVCVSNKATPRKVSVRPRLTLSAGDCTRCGKPLRNPLTHVCANTGDFARRRRRAAAAAKRAKGKAVTAERNAKVRARIAGVRATERARASERVAKARKGRRSRGPATPRESHDYSACPGGDCQRMTCRAWREGSEEGYQDGHEAGYAEGFAAGSRSAG